MKGDSVLDWIPSKQSLQGLGYGFCGGQPQVSGVREGVSETKKEEKLI